METRSRLTRRSALTAVAASALVALAAPVGSSAAAAPTAPAPAAPVVQSSVADLRLPTVTPGHPAATPMRGGCDAMMSDL
ncbi:hypothetical protein [Terrabacter terrigena]|uniref:Uncharacterized protein n=1 Tax=Terrabacter terrigena TaxID=574718 RepID=A0ABW3N1I3_9MICO